jgi:hypothetical protein
LLAFTTPSGCTQNWATCHPTLSSVNRHLKNLSNCPKLLDHYTTDAVGGLAMGADDVQGFAHAG